MKRMQGNYDSSLGRECIVRTTRLVGQILQQHMRQNRRNEQMAFGLGRGATTATGTLFLIEELILPDKDDLSMQSAGAVCPTQEFQGYVYFRAQQTGACIFEFHTHPGRGVPRFSGIDEIHAYPNGDYIRDKLPQTTTLVMIVGNNCFDAFDGVVYDRVRRQFRQLDCFEILGRPSEIFQIGNDTEIVVDESFDRQQRIPGWNQSGLEHQRIGIIGVGGNGAHVFQTLVGIGAGRQGFLVLADPDLVETTNLPRLPYSFIDQVGTPKVAAAVQYAGRKAPGTPVHPYPCAFEEEAVQNRMKLSTVLFFCGHNDGGRKVANEFAVRYGIPLIETGCDVKNTPETVEAGGQVRLVLPGENACLVCCRGFDPAQAAMDQMDARSRAVHASAGYVQGSDDAATPSVANLNAITAQLAISQLLALVNGESFAQWDYLHFDQFTVRTLAAQSKRRESCPICGSGGVWMQGDEMEVPAAVPKGLSRLVADSAN